MSNHSRRAHTATISSLCLLGLLGCQTPLSLGTLAGNQSSKPMQDAGIVSNGSASLDARLLHSDVVVDVDPLHGAAFERADRLLQSVSVTGTLKLLADFPQVRHDAASGHTTVTLQLTNAGDSLTFLKCAVAGDRKVLNPAYPFNTTAAAAGSVQTIDLVFDNPGGGSFTVNLSFTGTLARSSNVAVGANTTPSSAPTATPLPAGSSIPTPSATPTAAPSTAPTPTAAPTAMPTPAPTTAPTSTPTAAPSTAGAWKASASSEYGGATAANAIDGDGTSQWASAEYLGSSATWTLDMGAPRACSTVGVKTKPATGNSSYMIETSNDGSTFQSVAGPYRNTTWGIETKALPAGTNARFLRLHFTNDPSNPETRFSLFEVTVDSQGAPTSGVTPTATPTVSPTSVPTASSTPTPMASATPAPGQTPAPAPSGGMRTMLTTFDQYAQGSDPLDYIDPNDEGYSYSWMPRVTWRIGQVNGSAQYIHDGLSNTANLSFRRYRGTGIGTQNGLLPAHYMAELDVTPLQSYTYAPTGDQGTQVYYVDPTHYFEVLIKPSYYQVWACDNAAPFQSVGWHMLYQANVSTIANQTRHLGAEVDCNVHSLKAYLDGQLMTTIDVNASDVMSTLLTNQPHWFAMRGTGNIVAHDNVQLQPLP